MRFNISVDGKKVARQIERRIEDGIDNAADDISWGIERRAKSHIRREGAIWRYHLIEGFEDATVEFGNRTIVSVRNISDHASYQERGVSGTEIKRDTPHAYTNKKPPVTELIPWVRAHLVGTGFDPDYNPKSDSGGSSSGSDSGGSGGQGGTSVDTTDSGIPTDENGLYDPETNFREFDITDSFFPEDTFPGQEVVVYDTFDKKYRRADLVAYPDERDKRIEVKFHDDGGHTHVATNNEGGFKLVGGEFWDSLTTPQKKDRLRDHFDSEVTGSHTDFPKLLNSNQLTAPSSGRLDWVRDKWLSDLWDNYKDDWYVKESFRNMLAQFGTTQDRLKKKALGGILPNDDSTRYISTFLSKSQIQNYPDGFDGGESRYLDTLRHESLHAFTQSSGYGRIGSQIDWEKTLKTADWQRNGDQRNPDPDLPTTMRKHLFVRTDLANPDPVGGDDWIGDAYDAAINGESGIRNYNPSFNTPEDLEVQRLLEASNRAYWLQAVAGNKKWKDGNFGKDEPIFIEWEYSATNAEETLATLHKVMTSEYLTRSELKDLLEELDEFYPWLLEAWLNAFNPGTDQSDILSVLGYIL